MDVRLPDGTLIRGVPDDMSRADFVAKLKTNGYDVSKLDGQVAKPGQIPTDARFDRAPQAVSPLHPDWAKPRSFFDRATGAMETGAMLATGLPMGMVAPLVGLANESRANPMTGDRAAGEFMRKYTYSPRTPAGQEYAGAVGNVAQNLLPIAGLSGEVATLARNAKPAAQFAQDLDSASSVKTYTPTQVAAAKLNDPVAQGILKAREQGFSLPPTDAQAGIVARTFESMSGEPKLQKLASQKNAPVVNSLVRKDLGLGDDVPLTRSSISAVRQAAGEAYEPIKSAGAISVDGTFFADIDKASSNYTTAAKSFAHRSENPFAKVRDGLIGDRGPDGRLVQRKTFDAASAIEEVKLLRADADKAFVSGDKQLGRVYRDFSNALDDAIDRNLKATGNQELAGAVDKYRSARKLIAKTYLADDALNSATGNIKSSVYSRALDKRAPLDGPALDVAKFAKQFPRASQQVEKLGNPGGPTAIDVMGALLGKETLLLGARPAMRGFLASDIGQGLMKKPMLSSQMLPETAVRDMTAAKAPFDPASFTRGLPTKLGDLTPEWSTSPGAGAPTVDGMSPYGLVRSFDDPRVGTTRLKGRPQMPQAAGLLGVDDTAIAGRKWVDAASGAPERMKQAPMAVGGIELSRIIHMPKSAHRTKLLNDFKRRYPEAVQYIDENL